VSGHKLSQKSSLEFCSDLELWQPRFVCNIKVHCKEVKNTTSLLSVVMLLIELHVSAYSEAIIRFNKC